MLNTELFDGIIVFRVKDEYDLELLLETVREIEGENSAVAMESVAKSYLSHFKETAVRPHFIYSGPMCKETLTFGCYPVEDYIKIGYRVLDFYTMFADNQESNFEESDMDVSMFL